MSMLEVPGAELNYELIGHGPLLLFVPGAGGTGEIFKPAAHHLQSGFSVLTYDRRGLAGSPLTGPQDYSVRVQTDADDVARLIAHVDCGTARVLGSSSGGVVALRFMTSYPASFVRVIAHEPAALNVLPDGERWLAQAQATYDTYRTAGLQAALGGFVATMMSASDRTTLAAGAGRGDPARRARDFDYWFEHELRQYPRTEFDLDALRRDAPRLVFAVGQDTAGLPPSDVAHRFAEMVGAPVKVLPGGHVGFATYPEAFARELTALLG